MAGRLYVIEGLDGVGKSTVGGAVADYLDAAYMTTSLPDDQKPGPDATAAEKFGIYMDRNQHRSDIIEERLEQGETVVLDRYLASTLAYRTADTKVFGEAPIDFLQRVETGSWSVQYSDRSWNLHQPDATIYLQDPENYRQQWRKDRGTEDFEESNNPFMEQVAEEYERLLEPLQMVPVVVEPGEQRMVQKTLEALYREAPSEQLCTAIHRASTD